MIIPLALSAFTHLWNPIGFPSIHVDESHYMRRAMVVLNGHGPQDPYYPYDHPYFGQIFLAGVFAMIGYPSSLDNSSSISSSSPSSSFDRNNNNNNINNNNMLHSIEMLYLVPKVLMGLLAVVDTFLIYKISEYRYNRNVALIASILFAVMPITWLLRRVYLDSILMPFLLSSILFAVYTKNNSSPSASSYSYSSSKSSEDKDEDKEKRRNNHNNNTTTITNKNILLVLLSGIFLGLAIFTKVPVVALIPLVGFLIYTNNNNSSSSRKRRLKTLGLWVIPVILIPLIWPAYSISIGQFNLWWQGVLHQTDRTVNLIDTDINGSLLKSVGVFYQIDPVLLILGIAGLIFAGAIKRDFLILLWVIPFTIFFVAIGFAQYFYVIPILPAFCIAAARMISDLSGKKIIINIRRNKGQGGGEGDAEEGGGKGEKKKIQQILPFAIISGIGIFGLISITMLITTNVNSSFFQVYAFVVQHLPQNGGSSDSNNNNNNKVTMLGSHWWVWNTFWIPKYVFHKDLVIIDPRFDPDFKTPIRTEKILFIGDGIFRQKVLSPNIFVHIIIPGSNVTGLTEAIDLLYNNSTKIASFIDNVISYDSKKYPYTSMASMIIHEHRPLGRVDIRTNYY